MSARASLSAIRSAANPQVEAAWQLDEFAASLTSSAANTVAAYCGDVESFIQWAARSEVVGPSMVDRLLLRRYVASLTTRNFAKRSVARKVSSLRRYFAFLRRTGVLVADPSVALRAPSGHARARA